MANDSAVPFWDEGNTFTGRASAAVTGKRLLGISGPRVDGNPAVAHTAAGARAVGVSAFTVASGDIVTVYSAPGLIMPVTAGAAITAGQDVEADATGQAIPHAAGIVVGQALDDAASGADAVIKLV